MNTLWILLLLIFSVISLSAAENFDGKRQYHGPLLSRQSTGEYFDREQELTPAGSCLFHPSESSELEDCSFIFPENPELLGDELRKYYGSLNLHESINSALETFIKLVVELHATKHSQCPKGMKYNIENFWAYLSQQPDVEACRRSVEILIDEHRVMLNNVKKSE